MGFSFSDLQRWVEEGEGPALEFKSSVQKSAGESISAFANTYGGIIVFGVDAKKKDFKGLANSDEESRRLREILDQCRPNPKPGQEFIKHERKTIIVLKIEPFPYSHNPCFYSKRCWVRQGTTNLELAGEDLIDFLKKRTLLNFEESRGNASLKDLDFDKIERLLKARKIDSKGWKNEEMQRFLAAINVANYNGEFFLKNAALLFFAKEPQKFFSNLEVRIVKYAGTEPELGVLKLDKRIQGTVPEMIDASLDAVLENAGKTFKLSGLKRREVPDYPREALREVFTNALGHRDYSDGQGVLVELFEDRLQVTNPGGLLNGQTIANFDKTPQHRNPIAYRLLRDFGFGEGLGLGVRLIRRQLREVKLPDPEFYNFGNMFQVKLYGRASGKKRFPAGGENKRQTQALAFLEKNRSLKAAEYAKLVGVSVPTAVADLNELAKQGKIRKIGKFRGAYYELETLK
ncbi:MAG: RNA-binding domain-containing protein [Candidatus Micrarchaeota archaeon]